jgi:hypothetical protein
MEIAVDTMHLEIFWSEKMVPFLVADLRINGITIRNYCLLL